MIFVLKIRKIGLIVCLLIHFFVNFCFSDLEILRIWVIQQVASFFWVTVYLRSWRDVRRYVFVSSMKQRTTNLFHV